MSEYHNVQRFLDKTRGQLTIGEIPPVRLAALAAEGKHARVALLGRKKETFDQLLQRFDTALGKYLATGVTTDEVLPEIKRLQGT